MWLDLTGHNNFSRHVVRLFPLKFVGYPDEEELNGNLLRAIESLPGKTAPGDEQEAMVS